MQPLRFLLVFSIGVFILSCGGKNSSAPSENDSLASQQPDSATVANNEASAALVSIKPYIDKELSKWGQSFTSFTSDSLLFTHKGNFEQIDYPAPDNMKDFYSLYKGSLIYSPDSSYFIDLYSGGITLEKKGKKVIAMADADQIVTLNNTKANDWKRIAFFGPSAGIEEAGWTSPSQFILAGMMHNDDGKAAPILLLGDVNTKTFYWFEAKQTRPESSTYESGAMRKLKIDEWE